MATTKLQNVLLAFPVLWTPSNVNGEGPLKFSANGIFKPDSPADKLMKAAFLAAAIAKWGPTNGPKFAKTIVKDKSCYRIGNEHLDKQGDVRIGFEDMMYVVAKSKIRPTLLDQNKQFVTEESGILYAGAVVNMHIEVYAMDKPGQGKGIFATLTGVQKVKDGDPFSGGRAADPEEFEEVATEETPDYA